MVTKWAKEIRLEIQYTYRYSALSIRGLAGEYCSVYKDIQNGVLNKKNLSHIIDELVDRLKTDNIAKGILSEEFVTRFQKHCAAWDIKTQYENVRYIGRRLSNKAYYNSIIENLKELISENRQKKEIDDKASLLVREILATSSNQNTIRTFPQQQRDKGHNYFSFTTYRMALAPHLSRTKLHHSRRRGKRPFESRISN